MNNIHTKCPNYVSWLRDLTVLTLIFSVIFGFMLGSRILAVPDEARYAEIPREMVISHDYIVPRLNGVVYFEKPVLFYWMQSAAIKTLGYNEWSLRLPTALMALLGCLLTYVAGRKFFDRRSGFLASIILSTSILYFAMAHVITLDMTVSVLLSAALFSFLLGVRGPRGLSRRGFLLAMYLFAALAVLAKGLIGMLFPAMIIGAWIVLTRQWRLLTQVYLMTGTLLFLAVTVPWHWLVQKAYPSFFDFYFLQQHFLRYFTMAEHRYQPIWWFVPVLIIGFFPWITFLFQAIKQSCPREFKTLQNPLSLAALNSFLLLWISIIFIFYSFSHSKLVGYLLPIFPPLALLVGRYLATNWGNLVSRGMVWGFTIPALMATAGAAAIAFLPHIVITADMNQLYFYMVMLFVMLLLMTYIPLILVRRHPTIFGATTTFKTALGVLAFSTVFTGWFCNSGYAIFDDRSVYPLAQVLKPHLNSDTEVASYAHYYHDLPAYLQQKVIVAKIDHQNHELGFGMTVADTSDWMIGLDDFWQRWQSGKTMFMITSKKTYEKLLQEKKPSLFLIAKTNNDVLVSNKPL